MHTERQVVSVHEAGHAVIALKLSLVVVSASIIDHVVCTRPPRTRDEHWRQAVVGLAGPAAEQYFDPMGQPVPEWADYANAQRHADACGATVEQLEHAARSLVEIHWPAILRVAKELHPLNSDELMLFS